MGKKVEFSSPESTGAIFSQFYVALKKCFEMHEHDIIYIEIDGDVSHLNFDDSSRNEQIEIKEYSDNLTDSHKNFWNTINNWIRPEFDRAKYRNLILLTTQKIGDRSSLKNWNDSNSKGRLDILKKIKTSSEKRFEEKKIKNKKATPPDSLVLINKVLSKANGEILTSIIDKIFIDSQHSKRDEFVREIMNEKLKNIPNENRQKVLNGLMGYIVSTEDYNIGWEIKNESFSKEFQDISEQYIKNTNLFPTNPQFEKASESEVTAAQEYLFSKKIREIKYDEEVLIDAINDYYFTLKTISSEFSDRKSKLKSIEQYQKGLIKSYEPLYRQHSRKCNKTNLIDKSQDFYDTIMAGTSPTLDTYLNVNIMFKNGTYHDLANETKFNIQWKLKPNSND